MAQGKNGRFASPRRSATAFRQVSDAVRRASGTPGISLRDRLTCIPRMVRASVAGDYPDLHPAHLAALAAAAAYVLSPVDLLPESVLGVVGFADDAVVLAWFARTLVDDTDTFLAWEQARGQRYRGGGSSTIRGETV